MRIEARHKYAKRRRNNPWLAVTDEYAVYGIPAYVFEAIGQAMNDSLTDGAEGQMDLATQGELEVRGSWYEWRLV
jgi:hypothetical protein